MRALLLIIGTVALLAGCGFQPVYGVNQNRSIGTEQHLSNIQIDIIPNREGQYLRNALIDRLHTRGAPENPSYTLSVAPIQERRSNLDITKTADTTRAQLRLDSTFTLHNAKSGSVLLSRNIHSISSYNILASEFSSRVAEQATRENALNDLARQIETHLALWFGKS